MRERLLWVPLFLTSFVMCVIAAGCLASPGFLESRFMAGIYEGAGRGYRGPVHVELHISPSGIEDIHITSHRESSFPGLAAMEELLEAVLETGSADLDAISGATFSSRGFLEAVEDALRKARSP